MMLTGSVTEAAKLINVTQPAVSRLLRDFQALLKMELFEKRGTGLVPVAAVHGTLYGGRAVLRWSRTDSPATAEEIRSRRTGTLRIAALPALANGFLPRLSGRFLMERPNLNLSFFGVISPIVVDWVMNNQCDIGFAEVPIAHAGLSSVRLPAPARVAILPAGHRLAAKLCCSRAISKGETFVSLTSEIDRPAPDRPGLQSRRCPPGASGRDQPVRNHVRVGLIRSLAWRSAIPSRRRSSRAEASWRRPFPAADRFRIRRRFPPQRSPSPVALDLVEVMRQALGELGRPPAAFNLTVTSG